MTPAERAAALARCDAEIARLDTIHDEPAIWIALAKFDWEAEKLAIEREADARLTP